MQGLDKKYKNDIKNRLYCELQLSGRKGHQRAYTEAKKTIKKAIYRLLIVINSYQDIHKDEGWCREVGKKSENHLYSDLGVHEEKRKESKSRGVNNKYKDNLKKIVFTLTWIFVKNSAKRSGAEELTINTKTTFKIVFTLTWTFMKNSAKRARAEEFTINTKTTFKNRLYTNLDIHEE